MQNNTLRGSDYMTDIELAKECLSTYKTQGYFPHGEIYSFPKLLSSLITTIESQKEEIEKLLDEQKENENIIKRKLKIKQDAIDKSMTKIESLKAITELAVNGLQEIADSDYSGPITGEDAQEMRNEARSTLSEVERLSHIQEGKWFCIACSKLIPPEHLDFHKHGGCSPEWKNDDEISGTLERS
jgi:hypothetical protein